MPRVVKFSPFALCLETSRLASHPLGACRMDISFSSGASAHSALQYAKECSLVLKKTSWPGVARR
eukprot:4266446-Prymnesium_polylepis.1